MTSEQVDHLKALHFPVDEPDYGTMDPDPPTVELCYEDGVSWPCDMGYLLEALAASEARADALAAANARLREGLTLADEIAQVTVRAITVSDCGQGCDHPACHILRVCKRYQRARALLTEPAP
jgi:hypothetical protein